MAFTTSVIAVVGTVASVVGSIQQAEYSKKTAQTQATNTEEAYALNEAENHRQLAKVLGTQQAIYGAAGVDTDSGGSPFAVAQTTASNAGAALYDKRFETSKSESYQVAEGQQQANKDYTEALGSVFKLGSNKDTMTSLFE